MSLSLYIKYLYDLSGLLTKARAVIFPNVIVGLNVDLLFNTNFILLNPFFLIFPFASIYEFPE